MIKITERLVRRVNLVLLALVLVLATLCVMSVSAPIRFDRQRAEREAAVKKRLVEIRAAAERYRQQHGAYTGQWKELISSGCLADSLQYVPYGDGRRFRLQAAAVTLKSGKTVTVMECSATYADYLQGLDDASVRRLAASADASGRFGGLKIGDIDTPNDNSANWE